MPIQKTDPIPGFPRPEEGPVTAVMLDHEQPREEAGRWCRQNQGQPVPHFHGLKG
jgi:hypothetical protein